MDNYNHYFFKFIKNNLDKPLGWSWLSRNPNITWDVATSNPDKPWDWNALSTNLMILQKKIYMVQIIDVLSKFKVC
jgi:hypothetical protein